MRQMLVPHGEGAPSRHVISRLPKDFGKSQARREGWRVHRPSPPVERFEAGRFRCFPPRGEIVRNGTELRIDPGKGIAP